MRLDHLLSKEKVKSFSKDCLLFIFQCTFISQLNRKPKRTIKKYIYGKVIKYIVIRVKAHERRKRLKKTLQYGLIAQMVRAHA